MSPVKTHSSFTIQLIRDSNNKACDDYITIRQSEDDDDTVSLCYKDRTSNTQHEVYVTKAQASEYCISLFHILSYDGEPFENVQVNFPAFPSIILSVRDLEYESLRNRLQSMLWFTLENSFAV